MGTGKVFIRTMGIYQKDQYYDESPLDFTRILGLWLEFQWMFAPVLYAFKTFIEKEWRPGYWHGAWKPLHKACSQCTEVDLCKFSITLLQRWTLGALQNLNPKKPRFFIPLVYLDLVSDPYTIKYSFMNSKLLIRYNSRTYIECWCERSRMVSAFHQLGW